jgi:hypothetical protein
MEIICEKNRINGLTSNNLLWKIGMDNCLSYVDEENRFVIINYGGNFAGDWGDSINLKSFGFSLKNSIGKEIDYDTFDYCRLKINYDNISDISEIYFCYENQKIKIMIS